MLLVDKGPLLVSREVLLVRNEFLLAANGLLLADKGLLLAANGLLSARNGLLLTGTGLLLVSDGLLPVRKSLRLMDGTHFQGAISPVSPRLPAFPAPRNYWQEVRFCNSCKVWPNIRQNDGSCSN